MAMVLYTYAFDVHSDTIHTLCLSKQQNRLCLNMT